MPSQVSNATAIRADGYSTRVHASFYAPDPIIEATVTAAPNTQPITFLTVSIDSGDYTDIYGGMRVDVLTPNGDLKGRTRIRYGNTITSTVFHIRETSNAKLNVEVNDLVRVYPEVRLSDLLTEANQLFSPDGTPVGDFNENPPPIINSGGAWAGWVDDGETFASVIMTHSTSFVVDPDSGGTINHLTLTQTGVAIASGDVDTDPDVTLEVNVGQYLIRHEGEDDDNSKTGYSHTPVIVHDASNPPHEVIVTAYDGTPEDGFSWTIEILEGDTDLLTIPDGCLCILWTDERYAGEWASYRNTAPGRAHILGVGYCTRDTTNIGEDGYARVSVEVISPLVRLKQLTSYSKVMEENASPDHWNEIKTLGVLRGHTQINQWYTNAPEIFDFHYDSALTDYRYPQLYLQRATVYEQGNELLHGIDARMTADRTGRFSIHTSPWLIPDADRAAVTKTWRFNKADILELECTREHFEKVEKYRFSGFTGGASNNQPIFSDYPGEAPGEGVDAPTMDRLIAASQSDLNTRAGRHGAAVDGVYVDTDGARWRVSDLTLTLWGAYNFFDYNKELVDFTETFTALGRIDLTDFLFYPVSTSGAFDENGAGTTTLVLRMASHAPPGETYVPPPTDIGLPGDGFPPVVIPPITQPLPGLGLVAGLSTIRGVNSDGYLYTTTNFEYTSIAGGPSWVREVIPDLTGVPLDSVQSPFTTTRQIVVTDDTDAIYTVDGVGSTMSTTMVKTLRAAITDTSLQWRMVDASFGGNYVVVVSFYGNAGADSGTWYTYSLDGGDTWSTETQITAHYSSSGGGQVPGLFVSSRSPGVAYIGAYTASGSAATAEADVYRLSGTFGSPTAQSLGTSDIAARTIHRSWADNENTMYWTGADFSLTAANRGRIWRSVGGAARVDITPTIGGNKQGLFYTRGLHTCPLDANTVLAAVAGNTTSGVLMSRDKGTNWTQLTSGSTTDYTGAEVAGNSRDFGYVWGSDGAIGYVDLSTGTVDDRSGNLSTFTPGRFVRIRGA